MLDPSPRIRSRQKQTSPHTNTTWSAACPGVATTSNGPTWDLRDPALEGRSLSASDRGLERHRPRVRGDDPGDAWVAWKRFDPPNLTFARHRPARVAVLVSRCRVIAAADINRARLRLKG